VRTAQIDELQREGGVTMRDDERRAKDREPYERPTLTPAGSFTNMTGLGGHGPKDLLVKKQSL
jgi:hypothetical protein